MTQTKSPSHSWLEAGSTSSSPMSSYRSPRVNGVGHSPRVNSYSPRVLGTGTGVQGTRPESHHGDAITAKTTTGHFVPKSKSVDFGQQTVEGNI